MNAFSRISAAIGGSALTPVCFVFKALNCNYAEGRSSPPVMALPRFPFWADFIKIQPEKSGSARRTRASIISIRRDKEVQNRRDGQAFDATPEYYSMEMEIDESVRRSGLQLVMVFDLKHRKKLAELKRGESVAVAGTCKRLGRSVTIELLDCKLLFPK